MNPVTQEGIFNDTLVPALEAEDQLLIRRLAKDYELTLDEIRQLARDARDLEMWRETPLAERWAEWDESLPPGRNDRYRTLLGKLEGHLERLRTEEKTYPTDPLRGLSHAKPALVDRPAPTRVLTLCPYFTQGANCCGVHTIEAASGCALGCRLCSISAFVGDMIEFSTDLTQRLAEVPIDPDRFYQVCSGQSSDALAWGNRNGNLDALIGFARRHPNVLLELRTKSDRIDYLLKHRIPGNVVCSWLLNTDTVIRNEEHGTTPLSGRLRAARTLKDRGVCIGFHLNPLIHYRGWREEYASVVGQLMSTFSPEEIEFLSMSAVSLTQPVVREIRHRGGESKVLQMPLVEDPPGRLTYPQEIRVDLYSSILRALQPWRGHLFTYLCMETEAVWKAVFGQVLSVRHELEKRFRRLR